MSNVDNSMRCLVVYPCYAIAMDCTDTGFFALGRSGERANFHPSPEPNDSVQYINVENVYISI